jgi:hypothetical protein
MRVSNLESEMCTNEGNLSSVADHDTIMGTPENKSPRGENLEKETFQLRNAMVFCGERRLMQATEPSLFYVSDFMEFFAIFHFYDLLNWFSLDFSQNFVLSFSTCFRMHRMTASDRRIIDRYTLGSLLVPFLNPKISVCTLGFLLSQRGV